MSSDDIVALLRAPELCICVDAVLANCSPCNARIQAADEIERLRAAGDALAEESWNNRSADKAVKAWWEARRG